jgi:hypothetical protein
MSRKLLWNLDKVGWDLATDELGLGWTCPVQEMDMSDKSYWNPVCHPNKSG